MAIAIKKGDVRFNEHPLTIYIYTYESVATSKHG